MNDVKERNISESILLLSLTHLCLYLNWLQDIFYFLNKFLSKFERFLLLRS